jgi:hypothetical protein
LVASFIFGGPPWFDGLNGPRKLRHERRTASSEGFTRCGGDPIPTAQASNIPFSGRKNLGVPLLGQRLSSVAKQSLQLAPPTEPAKGGTVNKFLFWAGTIFVLFGWIAPWAFLSILIGYWILKD